MLRAIGLRCEIDIPTFLACAQEVAAQGRRVLRSADIPARSHALETAGMLAEHYAENASMLHGPQLYSGLSDLAFMPATQVCWCLFSPIFWSRQSRYPESVTSDGESAARPPVSRKERGTILAGMLACLGTCCVCPDSMAFCGSI